MVKKVSTKKSPTKKSPTKKSPTKKSQNKKIQEIISQHPGPVIVSPEVAKSDNVVFIPATRKRFAKVVPVAKGMPPVPPPPPGMSYSAPESPFQKQLRERIEKKSEQAKFSVTPCGTYEVWDPITKSCMLRTKQE